MPAENYAVALDAKLSNFEYLYSDHAYRAMSTALQGRVSEVEDFDMLVDVWVGMAQWALLQGRPYFFSGDVCQLVAAGANALDDYVLQREDIHATAGHYHFKYPFLSEKSYKENRPQITTRTVGLTWATYQFNTKENGSVGVSGKIKDKVALPLNKADGMIILAWDITDEYNSRPYGLPLSMTVWPFGTPLSEKVVTQVNTLPGPLEDYFEVFSNDCAVFIASTLFLQQTIIETADGDVNRQTRKQIQRDEKDKDKAEKKLQKPVVVALRKRKIISSDEAHLDEAHLEASRREYAYRFVVEGFWRNQHYGPRNSLIKRIWISDFIKGPEDKPLIVKRTKIAAVVR